MGNVRRIGRSERVPDVSVDGNPVALQLPVGGHGDFVPATDLVVDLVEFAGTFRGSVRPTELPRTVERLNKRRRPAVPLQRPLRGGVGDEAGVRGQLVVPDHLRIFPVVDFLTEEDTKGAGQDETVKSG